MRVAFLAQLPFRRAVSIIFTMLDPNSVFSYHTGTRRALIKGTRIALINGNYLMHQGAELRL